MAESDRKVMIIGLDGATWDVLDPLIAEGRMPKLKALVDRGAKGTLASTRPPITAAAWLALMTGKNPHRNGVLDFERYDPQTQQLNLVSTHDLQHVESLWQMLSRKGKRVGAIHIPMTYPPYPVNGFLISGFETPSVDAQFTYPKEIKDEILARWPDYTFDVVWKRKTLGGEAQFDRNLAFVNSSYVRGAEITEHFGEKYGWDVLMVVYKLVDNLQHKVWKYIDPKKWHDRAPGRRAKCAASFAELDVAVGRLVDYADTHKASVMLTSDHGHGSLEGKIHANQLLSDWGYLNLRSTATRFKTRSRYLLSRWLRLNRSDKTATRPIVDDLAIDFSESRACVIQAGEYGFLSINLEGRQETGIVDATEYEPLRQELRARFLSYEAKDAQGQTFKPFTEVLIPEEEYQCARSDYPWLPDLMLVPARGLSVVRKLRGRPALRWLPWRRIEGTHRPEGIFGLAGPGIEPGTRANARLIDVAPTVLGMLGLSIPDDLDGRFVSEAFRDPIELTYETPQRLGAARSEEAVYSGSDAALVADRLKDLGYLE